MRKCSIFLGIHKLKIFSWYPTNISWNRSTFISYSTISNMPFYAVAKGKKTGVYGTWGECQEQIAAFKGAVYKKFPTEEEALQFVQERGSNVIDKRNVSKPSKETNHSQLKTENKSSKKVNETQIGRISPTLLEMKSDMKNLQKELSNLRDRFDEYIEIKTYPPDESEVASKRKGDDEDNQKTPKKIKLNDVAGGSKDDRSKFTVNDDGFLVVYTDGACEFNGQQGARAGVGVYFGPGHPMNVSEPVKGRATNNTAEIQAATYALELTKAAGFDKVIINTDSQFMINCMTSWLPSWKKNNWRKKDGTEVINKEDLIDLDKASNGLLIKWNHVKGHDGIPGNEAADKLARDGAKKFVIEK